VTTSAIPRVRLADWCAGEGFHRTCLVDAHRLPAPLRRHPEIAALGPGTFLVAALSCLRVEVEDRSTPGDPHGRLAPFARANYYREAVLRLRRVGQRLHELTGIPRRSLRLFSNSRLPEKPLAAAAGLGSVGRNTLLLAPGLGSLFVIAGMFIPQDPRGVAPEEGAPSASPDPGGSRFEAGRVCGGCRACQEACPVGALAEPGRLDRSRCLQALAGRDGELSGALAEHWGFRLYGCQVCQEVCPWNRSLRVKAGAAVGELGPSLSLRWVLEQSPEELAAALRGTALGMSWISKRAIQRNALLAAAHRVRSGMPLGEPLAALIERYAGAADPQLATAGRRVLAELFRLGAGGRP
jgi:epoxyqueuosine reductase